jgi:trimeric autotransporter adhesin
MIIKAQLAAALAVLGFSTLCGCAHPTGDPANTADRLGSASIKVELAPTPVACMVIQVAGTATLIRQFDIAPQGDAAFSLGGLPLGSDTFSATAYSVPCVQIAGAQPLFISNSVTVTVAADSPIDVSLQLENNAATAIVSVAFPAASGKVLLAPDAVACIIINGNGATQEPYAFNITPEVSTVFSVSNVPLGNVEFSALVYNAPCVQSSTATVIWSSATVMATVSAGAVTAVSLLMTENPAADLVSLAVKPSNSSVAATATQQFMATGTYADGSTHNLTNLVTWSSNSADANITNPGGLATGVSAGGPITITASLTQDGTKISATAQLTVTSAGSSPGCDAAPSPKGGGAQPFDNQAYCGTLSGSTDVETTFTGTITFVTLIAPGAISACQYSSTLSPPSTPPTACAGTIDASGNITIVDAVNESDTLTKFTGTFSADGTTLSGTFTSDEFGLGGFVVFGNFNATQQ